MIEVKVAPTHIQADTDSDVEIRLTNVGHGACRNIIFTVRLPAGMVLLRGRDRISADALASGESFSSFIRLRASKPGRYILASPNLSYRDQGGQPHRVTGFRAEISADPGKAPVPVPTPRLSTELVTAELPLDGWSILRVRVTNTGDADALDLAATLSGQVTSDERGGRSLVPQLPPGASATVSFSVCALKAGTDVPVHLDLSYRGPAGRQHVEATHTVRVGRSQPARPYVRRVLFLGASPPNIPSIRIDEEIREIQQEIRLGKQRDRIQLETRWAVRPRDISRALLEVEPHFVHFAGHGGGGEESFAAEDEFGNASVVPVGGLVELFEVARGNVECVLVNACSTERLARGLSSVVRCVVGMRQPVGDRSAIRFSIGFYQGLSAGRPVEDAFRLGRAQMKMAPDSDNDPLAPLLLCRNG
jgi:hypothetical protein